MTQYRNTFEGGTNGVALSSTNLGGGSGNQPNVLVTSGGSTMVFDSTRAAHGTYSAHAVNTSTGATSFSYSGISATGCASRIYIYLTALPTADMTILRHTASVGNVAYLKFISTGALRIVDNAGTTIATLTGTPPLNTWVRYDLFTNTTTNQVSAAYATLDAAATVDTGLLTASLGGGTVVKGDLGKVTGVYATDTWYDDPAVDDAATGYIAAGVPAGGLTGTLTLVPTSGTVGTNASTTATANFTGGTGTTKLYSFNFGDGSATVGPQTSNVAAHTYTTAGTVTGGVTAPYTVTVTVTNT